MKVRATQEIGQNAADGYPAYLFASKGQVLDVIQKIEDIENPCEFQKEYKYICQDVDRQYGGFYVKEHEVETVVS